MNQRKWNKKPWYMLALALLLCVTAVLSATGTALARYRAERDQYLNFQVRTPAQFCLGTVKAGQTEDGKTTETFVPNGELTWVTVTEADLYTLDFAVANGESAKSYSRKAQKISLRLISSAGFTEDTELFLRLPPQTEGGAFTDVPAVVTSIEEGTALYSTNGYGYIYTFCQQKEGTEETVELSWELPGGEFAYIPFTIVMKGNLPEYVSLLQPQIVAELID